MNPPGTQAVDAGSRLRRLLAVLAHLAEVQTAPIAELAARFGMDSRTLVAELELAACCGLPPYTPDSLLELVVDDEQVSAHGLDALRTPPRLTPDEGFALAASLRAMAAVPGAADDGPLVGALDKLERVLGLGRVTVEIDAPPNLAEVQQAAASGEAIEIDYLGSKRGDESTRRVEPYAVVAREGRFYLDAYCSTAGDWRRFQVARIRAVRRLGEPVASRSIPPSFSSARAFVGGGSSKTAHVALDESRYVLVDRFASGPTTVADDGRLVVPIEVADEHFLGRLLLRLGPGAEVLDPPELIGAAARVAERALARYRETTA